MVRTAAPIGRGEFFGERQRCREGHPPSTAIEIGASLRRVRLAFKEEISDIE